MASDELNDSVAAIVWAERQAKLVGMRREDGTAGTMIEALHEQGALPEEDAVFDQVSLADLVDLALGQRCSSKAALVEHGGFEPPTSAMRMQRSSQLS